MQLDHDHCGDRRQEQAAQLFSFLAFPSFSSVMSVPDIGFFPDVLHKPQGKALPWWCLEDEQSHSQEQKGLKLDMLVKVWGISFSPH